jgi:class 3 adenylate cyclase
LQALFAATDRVAKKFKIFKVETIGDCYMAVTELPHPQNNDAELIARFATECLKQMKKTTTHLESTLGDDTVELSLRIGLHSGPVTAGILRGEKSRFQLFGDTVNTASRMESTGGKDRIQISSSTAELLIASGKGHWLNQREDLVEAKGKGKLQTYWLVFRNGPSTTVATRQSSGCAGPSGSKRKTGATKEGRPAKSKYRIATGELIDV